MSETFPVLIAMSGTVKRYSPAFQTDEQYASAWHSVLRKAYRNGAASCACDGKGPAKLAIKHFSASNTFYLAKFARTGGEHSQNCQFWSNDSVDGAAGCAVDMIRELPDGCVQVLLSYGMTATQPTPRQPGSPVNEDQGQSSTRPAMRLLGLLQYLWVEASLNTWRKGWENRRNKSNVFWRLNGAASMMRVGDRELDSVLLLPADSPTGKDAARNRERVDAAAAMNSRLIVIAPLAKHSAAQEVAMRRQLKIAGFHGMPPIFLEDGLWATCGDRYANAVSAWKHEAPVIAIAQIELKRGSKGITAQAVDLALMAITKHWIPVESAHERAVAERLVAEMRSFRKPMRFDRSDDLVLPDFVLEDTNPETPCEVFGMAHAQYRERMVEKSGIYRERYGVEGWWAWDAVASPDPTSMPDFPPPR